MARRAPSLLHAVVLLGIASHGARAEDTPTPPPPAATPEQQAADAYTLSLSDEVIAAQSEPTLRFYGFADFQASVFLQNALGPLFGESPLFSVGNFNLYMAAQFSERWRSLSEVRFTFLPDGTVDSTLKRISTDVYDTANLGARLPWGGISIQRVWLEYSAHELLTIRAGLWLTPVGIWNVDHGTPTIIPAFRPYVISVGYFPERQTGIELYGSHLFGRTTLGYHLTISNGRGGANAYMDLDKNKALGGRLFATFTPLGTLTLGGSIYSGKATNSDVKLENMKLAADIKLQYDELAYAADLLWKWAGIHLQGELFVQSVAYAENHRPLPSLPTANGGRAPDFQMIGGYALLGYRLPWWPVMPFIQFESQDFGGGELSRPGARRRFITYAAGFNYQPIANVTLKGELYHMRFYAANSQKAIPNTAVMLTTAWSF